MTNGGDNKAFFHNMSTFPRVNQTNFNISNDEFYICVCLCTCTGCTRKTRIIDVVYNASNNELVRTKTLVKNCIVLVDSLPYRQWYEAHYATPLGRKKGAKLVCWRAFKPCSFPFSKWFFDINAKELQNNIKQYLKQLGVDCQNYLNVFFNEAENKISLTHHSITYQTGDECKR